ELLNYTAERAPSAAAVSAGTGAGASSSMAAMSMSMSIEDVVMVLNTADYCYTTTTQLEEKLRSRIDEPLRKQIDLQSQADAFMGIASSCVRLLVRGVVLSLEPAWREMRNLPWANVSLGYYAVMLFRKHLPEMAMLGGRLGTTGGGGDELAGDEHISITFILSSYDGAIQITPVSRSKSSLLSRSP
ncbi:Vacuolar protein sorting-associated protein 53, partial [Ascosphaera atra]